MAEAGLDLDKAAQVSLIGAALDDPSSFVLPPLPNSLFTRDSSCWIYGGVSINPMYWPARRREAYNLAAIYRAHPMFVGADFEFWYPPAGPDGRFEIADFGLASLEGGDVMPIGNGAVLIGMSERSQGRMIEQIAKALFAAGAAERVIACVMSKDRAHMHLDTVFTLLDRDKATAYPKVIGEIRAISLRPGSNPGDFHVTVEDSFLGAVADALGVAKLHVVETGGDVYQQEREQWDDGNNVVALAPGRRHRLRAQHLHHREDARGRRRGHRDRRLRARQGPGRRPLHDLPAPAGPGVAEGCWPWPTRTSTPPIAGLNRWTTRSGEGWVRLASFLAAGDRPAAMTAARWRGATLRSARCRAGALQGPRRRRSRRGDEVRVHRHRAGVR